MVVVQGKPLPVVLGQFALGMEGRQPGGSCLLPGRGVLVVGDVEQVHGPAGQEPAVLAPLGHAPHHRGDPAAPPQGAQHPSYLLLVQAQHRRQVGHAGRGILAAILNRRLSSSFNGSRRAIAAPPFCPGTRAVGWFPPPANRSPGQGRGPPDCHRTVRLRSWGMHLSMCLGQGLWY